VTGALIPAGAIFGLRRAANVRRRDRLEIIAKLATVLEVEPAEPLKRPTKPGQSEGLLRHLASSGFTRRVDRLNYATQPSADRIVIAADFPQPA
jgi:hypothetical protein